MVYINHINAMKKIFLLLFLATSIFTGCDEENPDIEEAYIKLLNVKQNSGDPAVYADLSYGNIKCATSPESGVVWSVTPNPTTSSNKVVFATQCYSNSGGNVKLSNVPAKTKIYIKGYTLTSVATLYSQETSITTN